MPDALDFEEPIAVLLKEIETLAALPSTLARDREIESLRRRIESVRGDLYRSLTPWQRVQVARHPNRPGLEFFIERLFTGFTELHGDRRFADDHAIMTGFAEYRGDPVLVVGHVKGAGGDTKDKIFRNFGYARPEGYRKALRAMRSRTVSSGVTSLARIRTASSSRSSVPRTSTSVPASIRPAAF